MKIVQTWYRPLVLMMSIWMSNSVLASSAIVEVVSTITHADCYDVDGDISYQITISTGWLKKTGVNSLTLTDENGVVVYTHVGFGVQTGSILNLAPGRYHYEGSVTAKNTSGLLESVLIDQFVWVGIETSWDEMIDMAATPTSYSATRDATTQTYGGAYSKNYSDSGEEWIQLEADYAGSTASHLYLVIGETTDASAFSPTGSLQYVEFYQTSSVSGIDVRELQTGSGYLNSTVSTNPNDVIRLVRDQYDVLTIEKNDDPTAIFTFDVAYSGPLNVAVFALQESDACIDAISTMSCRMSSDVISHAQMHRVLDGGFTMAANNLLKVVCIGEYEDETSQKLHYNLYDKERSLMASCDASGATTGGAVVYAINFDDNRYEIDLSGISGFVAGAYYQLEVIDTKGEIRILKFMFKY